MKAWDEESDDSLLRRPVPSQPYVRSGLILTVPAGVLDATLRVFQSYARRRVESSCFWYGVRDEAGNGRVLSVAVAKQFNHWGNYRVEADAVAAIASATRAHDWKNLSQVHTHPGTSVEHSRYDDAHANSRRALSVVFPLYGLWKGKWPGGVGIHEFQNDYWHLLSPADAAARIAIDARDMSCQLIDTRS
jgi:hypothetical protein